MTKRMLIGAALAALLAIPAIAWATGGSTGCPLPCNPPCAASKHLR
jgi:hypothetical protein